VTLLPSSTSRPTPQSDVIEFRPVVLYGVTPPGNVPRTMDNKLPSPDARLIQV